MAPAGQAQSSTVAEAAGLKKSKRRDKQASKEGGKEAKDTDKRSKENDKSAPHESVKDGKDAKARSKIDKDKRKLKKDRADRPDKKSKTGKDKKDATDNNSQVGGAHGTKEGN